MQYVQTAHRAATAWKRLLVPDELPAFLAKAWKEHTEGNNFFENNGPDLDNAADEDPERDDLHEYDQVLQFAQRMCEFLALRFAFGKEAALSGKLFCTSGTVLHSVFFAHCFFLMVLLSQQRSPQSDF